MSFGFMASKTSDFGSSLILILLELTINLCRFYVLKQLNSSPIVSLMSNQVDSWNEAG